MPLNGPNRATLVLLRLSKKFREEEKWQFKLFFEQVIVVEDFCHKAGNKDRK